jgi:polygalacturonase
MSVFRFTFIALLVAGLGTAAFADEMPRVDAARFGFSPSAAASKNVAALQKALNGGHKTVSVTTPGIYDLDATVYLDSHTRLACCKGVTLRKAAPYGFIVRGNVEERPTRLAVPESVEVKR